MFSIALVSAIYNKLAVIYGTLATKSTREHTRGIYKCSNGQRYTCLKRGIEASSAHTPEQFLTWPGRAPDNPDGQVATLCAIEGNKEGVAGARVAAPRRVVRI